MWWSTHRWSKGIDKKFEIKRPIILEIKRISPNAVSQEVVLISSGQKNFLKQNLTAGTSDPSSGIGWWIDC